MERRVTTASALERRVKLHSEDCSRLYYAFQSDFDDDERKFKLLFGPVDITLGSLVDRGYFLMTSSFVKNPRNLNSRVNVYLQGEGRRFKLARGYSKDFQEETLFNFLPSGEIDLLRKSSPARFVLEDELRRFRKSLRSRNTRLNIRKTIGNRTLLQRLEEAITS